MPWKRFTKECEQCKQPYLTSRSNPHSRFCSDRCRGDAKMGDKHPRYKGGRSINKTSGYASKSILGRSVMEHRHVMEVHLGRPLLRTEHVHHINGDRSDNRLENLELHSSQTDHLRKCHSKNWVDDDHYRCSRCNTVKLHSDFYKRTSRPMGHMTICKACVSEIDKLRTPRKR